MFDYEKYILHIPEPVLLRMLRFLRYPDLINLKTACPELEDYCNLHIRLLDQEFPRRPFFQFERCAPERDIEEDDNIEIMSERQNVSMVYYPGNRSVYLFGGEVLDTNDDLPAATFNDMWRLDTATMKWSRVIISSPPYPSPKCHASLIVWNEDKLILYGGRAARPHGRDVYYSELHYFHIKTATWEYITTGGSYNIGGHSAIATRKFMIVFGECVSFDEYDTMFLVLNVETRIFNTVSFDGLLLEEVEDFPEFDVKKTKLVLIREGLLLLTGELEPGNYGSSVLIEFNPELFIRTEPLPWRWKLVETIGRWWRPKNQVNEDEDVENCALPNFNFYQIADVRNSGIVRLVSMGKIRTADQTNRSPITEKYKAVQALYREFCRQLKCHLETEFQRRYVEKSCAVFQYQNIKCRIDGCFIRGPIKRSRNAHRFKVSVKIGSAYSNPNMPNFDDFDKWELRVSIRAVVNQLHSKYYNIGRMDQLAPRVPMRNSTLKRLSVYVADIDSNVAFENFNELRWTCQPTQYQAPVETREFALVGAHHDVIMHAGTVRFNETMRRMGQTTLMTPIANV